MSRRFTLFALLTAVCLLFASCGALTLSSRTSTLVIPLNSAARNVTMHFGQKYCERYEFTLYNKDTTMSASGTDYIVFNNIPYGTYTLDGKAIGTLIDGKEHVIATSKNTDIMIAGSDEVTLEISFVLEDVTFENTSPTGNEYIEYTQDDEDDPTELTRTVYADNSKNIKVTETEENLETGTVIVREYASTEANPITKETETQTNGTVIVREFTTDTEHPTTVTVKTTVATTIETFTGGEWTNPATRKIIESTKTTTTVFNDNKTKASTVTEEITAGTNAGQTTVTVYNTEAAGTVRSTVTVTKPDNSSVVTTFNSSDKETKKVETDTNNVSTVTLFSYGSNTKSETLYETGYPAVDGTSIADKSKAVRTVENTYNGEGEVVSTAITDFEYVDITAYDANDTTQTQVPPYKKTTTCTTVNGITSTTITTYVYSTESSSLGKQTNKTTTVDGVETSYERYVYGEDGLFITESYKTTNGTGYTTKEVVYRYDTVRVIVKDRDNTSTTLFDKKGGSVRCSSTVTTTYNTLGEELSTNTVDNGVSADAVLDFLSQNYYVGGSSLANLNFVNDSTATASQYAYFYHVDFADFYANHNNCFKYDAISNGTLTCYLHNDKSGCSNFWDATIADSNGNSQKFSSHITGNNLGTAGN